jgi:hypothetical protein
MMQQSNELSGYTPMKPPDVCNVNANRQESEYDVIHDTQTTQMNTGKHSNLPATEKPQQKPKVDF